jgi:hypothetical protein
VEELLLFKNGCTAWNELVAYYLHFTCQDLAIENINIHSVRSIYLL